MYSHLLIPTDGSELSNQAVEKGICFAKSLNARITFLFVKPDFPLPIAGEGALLVPESREEFSRSSQEQALQILDKAMTLAKQAGVTAETRSETSDLPYQVIVNTAKDAGCDLIFMASHGRRGLAGILLGSETHKVLTHCTIPVLVYR
jgi:nucleotide-binding universal stress UspA family protein